MVIRRFAKKKFKKMRLTLYSGLIINFTIYCLGNFPPNPNPQPLPLSMRSLQQARLFLETPRRGGQGSHPDKLLYMVDDPVPLSTDIQRVFQILLRPKRPEKFQGIYFVQFYNYCSV
jgi:hypothetical protein